MCAEAFLSTRSRVADDCLAWKAGRSTVVRSKIAELMPAASFSEAHNRFAAALGQTKDPELIQDFLNFGIDTEQVRSQDVL